MQPGSPTQSPDRRYKRIAAPLPNFLGGLIAGMTIALPLMIISQYSNPTPNPLPLQSTLTSRAGGI